MSHPFRASLTPAFRRRRVHRALVTAADESAGAHLLWGRFYKCGRGSGCVLGDTGFCWKDKWVHPAANRSAAPTPERSSLPVFTTPPANAREREGRAARDGQLAAREDTAWPALAGRCMFLLFSLRYFLLLLIYVYYLIL